MKTQGIWEQVQTRGVSEPRLDFFIAYVGNAARDRAIGLAIQLRIQGYAVQLPTGQRSLRAQLRAANQLRAQRALIIGDNELQGGQATLRDLDTGNQQQVPLDVGELTRWQLSPIRQPSFTGVQPRLLPDERGELPSRYVPKSNSARPRPL